MSSKTGKREKSQKLKLLHKKYNCPQCGTVVNFNDIECPKCNVEFWGCNFCGAPILENTTMCPACGQNLEGEVEKGENLPYYEEEIKRVQKQVEQPSKVGTAVTLLYATLGIGIIRSIIESSRYAEASSVGYVIYIMFSVFGLMWFLFYMIGKGRNWARITFLILFILGVPSSIFIIQSLTHNPISGILGIAQVVMQSVALVFLFQGGSSVWFKAMKQSKTKNAQQGASANL